MVLLVLVGAVPATLMYYFAFLMAMNGFIWFVTQGGWENLLNGAWGLAGVLGTLALWRIALGYETLLAYSGLIVGVIAATAVPITLESSRHLSLGELLLGSWMMPVYCALYLIGELVIRSRRFSIRQGQTEAEESGVE